MAVNERIDEIDKFVTSMAIIQATQLLLVCCNKRSKVIPGGMDRAVEDIGQW